MRISFLSGFSSLPFQAKITKVMTHEITHAVGRISLTQSFVSRAYEEQVRRLPTAQRPQLVAFGFRLESEKNIFVVDPIANDLSEARESAAKNCDVHELLLL